MLANYPADAGLSETFIARLFALMPQHSSVFHSLSTLESKAGMTRVRRSPVSLATVQDFSVGF